MATDEATEADKTVTAPPRAVAAARAFVREHGGSGRAVVANIGQAGARIVLVGEDGALGDVVLPDVATARAVVDAVDDLEPGEWDSDTTAALKIGPRHHRRMAGPLAR